MAMDGYSRVIAFLKVLLPLAALALLSMLFLLSRSIDPTATIPFAETEIEDRLRNQQITAPFFTGTTASGDQIMMMATTARPGAEGRPTELNDMAARIDLVGGTQIMMQSDSAALSTGGDLATMTGRVRIRTSQGFDLTTEMLETALRRLHADAPQTITGTSPAGQLTAGAMQLRSDTDGDNAHLVFTNGVKLVYEPKQPKD